MPTGIAASCDHCASTGLAAAIGTGIIAATKMAMRTWTMLSIAISPPTQCSAPLPGVRELVRLESSWSLALQEGHAVVDEATYLNGSGRRVPNSGYSHALPFDGFVTMGPWIAATWEDLWESSRRLAPHGTRRVTDRSAGSSHSQPRSLVTEPKRTLALPCVTSGSLATRRLVAMPGPCCRC